MSENDQSRTPPASPSPSPRLPDLFSVPTQLIDSWFDISPDIYVEIGLTRSDFDRLYSSINKSYLSQQAFQKAMVDYSNGNTEGANVGLFEARRLTIEGQNELRQLMTAVMASATKGRNRE